jgi:hypothetical protein
LLSQKDGLEVADDSRVRLREPVPYPLSATLAQPKVADYLGGLNQRSVKDLIETSGQSLIAD